MFTRDKPAEPPATPPVKAVEVPPRPQERAAPAAMPAHAPEQATSARARPASEASRISAALKITGQLESEEDIQVDGHIEGDIRARKVTIGTGASVKGTVFGQDVELSGTVTGKIEATSVVLSKSARMSGDVVHQTLQIEKGAYIDGHCRPQAQSDTLPQDRKRADKQNGS